MTYNAYFVINSKTVLALNPIMEKVSFTSHLNKASNAGALFAINTNFVKAFVKIFDIRSHFV